MTDNIQKSLNLISGKVKNGNITKEIAWRVFLEPLNQTGTFQKINPKEYNKRKKTYEKTKRLFTTTDKSKKERKSYKKCLNTNAINNCFKAWNETNFLTTIEVSKKIDGNGNSTYNRQIPLRQFNLNPLFVYLENKNVKPSDSLSKSEIFILKFLFEPKQVREKLYEEYKNEDFITAMLLFYIKYYYIPFLKNPIISTKNTLDKEALRGLIEKGVIINTETAFKLMNLLESNSRYFDKETLRDLIERGLLDKKLGLDLIKSSKSNKVYIDNLKKEAVVFNHDFYLGHYASLHKYYKEIIEQLDNKILKILKIA